MDALTIAAQSLGSPNVVVITREDLERVYAIMRRAGEEGFLTEEERLAWHLIELSSWTCPGAEKVSI